MLDKLGSRRLLRLGLINVVLGLTLSLGFSCRTQMPTDDIGSTLAAKLDGCFQPPAKEVTDVFTLSTLDPAEHDVLWLPVEICKEGPECWQPFKGRFLQPFARADLLRWFRQKKAIHNPLNNQISKTVWESSPASKDQGFIISVYNAKIVNGDEILLIVEDTRSFDLPDTYQYVDDFKHSKRHGDVVHIYPDGERYEGSYENGQRDQGTMTWPDGRRFEGSFKNDRIHGNGTYTWPDGAQYLGSFVESKMHGQGTYTWPNGKRYDGSFKDGRMHGQGTLVWSSGKRFEGSFVYSKMHGQGTLMLPDHRQYKGSFQNDRIHGRGTYTWPDGARYRGSFVDGEMHGQGRYKWPDGKRYRGTFRNNRLVGYGTFKWPDGRRRLGHYNMSVEQASSYE